MLVCARCRNAAGRQRALPCSVRVLRILTRCAAHGLMCYRRSGRPQERGRKPILLHRDSTRTGGTTMTFSEAISSGFRNYVGFSGRAARSEFWYWILFTVLVEIVTSIVDVGIL